MIPLMVFGAIVIVPVLLALILRVNAVFVFLSAAAGWLLQGALSDDVDFALATVIRGSNAVVASRLILMFLPVVLTIFILRRTSGKSAVLQIMPLVSTGLMMGVLSLPLLSTTLTQQIYEGPYGSIIKQSQDLVITGAVVLNILLMWTIFKSPRRGKHH